MSTAKVASCHIQSAEAARTPWKVISAWLTRRAARTRHYRALRELAELPPELQRDIGVVPHLPPQLRDARSLDHNVIGGTYW